MVIKNFKYVIADRLKFESRKMVTFFFVLSLVSTTVTCYFSYKLNQSLDDNIMFQEHRNKSIAVAEELRQSSDDLTNFARLYAVTENVFYKQAYQRIIDIRNGDSPIPSANEVNDWCIAVADKQLPAYSGEFASIEDRMKQLGMDDEEMSHIQTSKRRSDVLANIELDVFRIIEDNANDWKIKKQAKDRLFDDTYLFHKLQIMMPIKEFHQHVDERTKQMVIKSEQNSKFYLIVTIITSIITFVIILAMRFTIYLGRQSNRIIERKRQYLESILDSSCLVSRADKHGKITAVNDKFCKVSGYKETELIGQDHAILNSGYHPRKFWINMYKHVVVDKGIWHNIVTNRNKKGEQYIVDSYIMATFDESGNHDGYISVRQDITELMNSLQEVDKKNVYLEHAAKILRHDMHSGINTYIPRGITSLERRLEKIQKSIDPKTIYKDWRQLEAPMKLLKEGIHHAQRVYSGVKEFTNLVKKDAVMYKETYDLRDILDNYLKGTAYRSQVQIDDLGLEDVNESLFCTAIDNLIRNGLRYNDSDTKIVKLYKQDNDLIVEDNGRGMTQKEFEELAQPYTRRAGQKESGSGLGLNICVAIMQEHGFQVTCEKIKTGTKLKIKVA